jgi:rhodanese-related sulfurtransferase
MVASITSQELAQSLDPLVRPIIVDVRRESGYRDNPRMLPWAIRRLPDEVGQWMTALEIGRPVIVYCVHGHEVSQGAASALAAAGFDAAYLDGGVEGWAGAGLRLENPRTDRKPWVTRARPKIDRVACPWLVRRFVDADAQFVFVPPQDVISTAAKLDGIAYDVPDVAFTHVGSGCSFDTFIDKLGLDDPALSDLADIVRAADTGRFDLAPQAAGLLAVSLGLSARFRDDHEMLRHGFVVYDALYAWLRSARGETHSWPPAA